MCLLTSRVTRTLKRMMPLPLPFHPLKRFIVSWLGMPLALLCAASCGGSLSSSAIETGQRQPTQSEGSLESAAGPEGEQAVADAVTQHLHASMQALADEYGRAVEGGTARFSICTTQYDLERDMEVTDCSIVGNEPLEGDRAYEQETEDAGGSKD